MFHQGIFSSTWCQANISKFCEGIFSGRPTFPNPFVTQKVIKLGDKIYVNLNLKPKITFGVTRMICRCCSSLLLVSDSKELQHGLTSVIKIKYTILPK